MTGRMAVKLGTRERHFDLETRLTDVIGRAVEMAKVGALVASGVGLELLDAVRAAREELSACQVVKFPPTFNTSPGFGAYRAHAEALRWTLAITVAMSTARGPRVELLERGLTLLPGLRQCQEMVRS